MTSQTYTLFDGTAIDMTGITGIGPINWVEDSSRPGACGEFEISRCGRRPESLSFGVSALVGAFRFMEAVRSHKDSGDEGCPARMAYASLSSEARRMLEMRHADLVSAWQASRHLARAA